MKWEDPPDNYKRIDGKWAAEADELITHPGQWAKLAEGLTSIQAAGIASTVRGGVLKNFRPAGAFESMARNGAVYARYVGLGKEKQS